MHSLETSGFAEFDRMAALFRRTRDLLDVLSATHELPAAATEVIATETLPHVEDIEEGARTASSTPPRESAAATSWPPRPPRE